MAGAVAAALAAAGGQGQRLLRGCVSATVRPPRFSEAQGPVGVGGARCSTGWGVRLWMRARYAAAVYKLVRMSHKLVLPHQRWRQLSFLVQKLLATPWKVDVDWRPPVDMHLACRRLQFVDQEWVLCDEGPSPPQPADVPFPRFL